MKPLAWRAGMFGRLLLVPIMFLGAGCDLLPDWLGAPETDEPLPGERVSILTLEEQIEPDPELADTPVRLPRPYVNDAWPQPGGSPSNVLGHLAGAPRLNQVWSTDIGEGDSTDQRILSTPVVAEGRLFALDARLRLSALDAGSGDRLWRVDLMLDEERRSTIGGGVAYADGRLFVTTGYGHIIALDATNGSEIWRTPVGAPIRAAPTVANSRVFAVSFDNSLVVLSAEDGSLQWRHTGIAETAGLLGAAAPAVADNVVIAPFSSGEVFAFRVDDGRELWSDTLILQGRFGAEAQLTDVDASPVISDGTAYTVSHSGRLLATDLDSGQRIWNQEVAGKETPWVAGNWIYLVTVDAEVVCLRRDDGRIRWVQTLQKYDDPEQRAGLIVWSGPVLIGDRLVVVGSNGEAMAISPYTGRLLGREEMPEGSNLPPIVAQGTLYLLTEDAELVALR